MSDKVLIRKESKVKFLSFAEVVLYICAILVSFICQFMGVNRIIGVVCVLAIFSFLLFKIIYILIYDLRFTNETYDYVIFDSVKLIIVFMIFLFCAKNVYDYKFAEKGNMNVVVSSITSEYSYINYNMTLNTEESGKFYFASPFKYLDLSMGDAVEGCAYNVEYIEYHDNRLVTKMTKL